MTSASTRVTLSVMRLAAIDVGSNSVHMLIADVNRDGHIEVVDRVKEMVRLGRKSFTTGRLTEESMDLAVRALMNFRRLLKVRRIQKVHAVATSAVREANNRTAFIRRIRKETGIAVEVISGQEEARLIFQAARHALGLEGGPFLLVDVGGGSVELVLVKDGRRLWMHSVKLGVARMSEQFLTDDPPTATQRRHLEKHLEDEIGELMRAARKAKVVSAIGTSGTINTLVAMARAARGEELGRLHGATRVGGRSHAPRAGTMRGQRGDADRFAGDGCETIRPDAGGGDAGGFRAAQIGRRRTDGVHVGACARVCCWGSRVTRRGRSATEARRRSVMMLAKRFCGTNEHGKQVARLALKLFDATALLLGLPASARELLEYSALLHDVGHAIDHDRHNRHSYYLIKNAELLGFAPAEIEVIAQAARGHRKQAPNLDSSELQGLSAGKRRMVRGLAAILRVADALDRSHFGVVRGIDVRYSPGRLIVEVASDRDKADLELWTGERRTDLLAKLLDRRVVLRQ